MMTGLLMMVALSAGAGVMYRVTMSLRTVRFKPGVYFHRVVGALAVLAILLPCLASAHGNVAMEEDSCVQRVGGSLVHFNAYQPQHEANAQYCTEIPGEGDTFLVVDLVDPGLRNLPVGIRVVRGLGETAEDQTVAYWPPVTHPDGVVRGEATLAKGLYQVIIIPEGFSPSSYLLRVQQIDYATIMRKAIGPMAMLLLLALIGYEVSKSTRWRNWRVFGSS
ncbi:hypothetical protein [Candidatus Nitrospira nitrificans]|uniref:Uncharacterized protein n=1 Tax=Candidatus Nitrospira nitrificans TaxID=1742973 RepID=A0A0S4LHT1_9BACT|nr:hypothetical protein [Candidatus Nitrospira nitrificans]CUS35556.1 conserved membrane hypothetical protein [Candidatus Nitrospira nitrificans]